MTRAGCVSGYWKMIVECAGWDDGVGLWLRRRISIDQSLRIGMP